MRAPTSPTAIGVIVAIGATIIASVAATAIASWGTTSDTVLVNDHKVTTLGSTVKEHSLSIRAVENRVTTFETHQRYMRQQVQHTDEKVDALLEHFAVEKPPEPPLPAAAPSS